MAEIRLALSDSHRVEGTGRCKSKTRTDESTDEQGINAVWETKNPHFPKESTMEARVGIGLTIVRDSKINAGGLSHLRTRAGQGSSFTLFFPRRTDLLNSANP